MTVVSITPVDKRRCKVLLEEGFALILYRGEIKKIRDRGTGRYFGRMCSGDHQGRAL